MQKDIRYLLKRNTIKHDGRRGYAFWKSDLSGKLKEES